MSSARLCARPVRTWRNSALAEAAVRAAFPRVEVVRSAAKQVMDETGQCIEQPYEETVDPDSGYKDRVKVKGLKVVKIFPEKNYILISGAVPGHNGSIVLIQK